MIAKSIKTGFAALIFVLPALVFAAAEAQTAGQKFAVAADGGAIAASVSQRTGRAPFMLIFDADGNLIESLENPAIQQRRTGPALAQWLDEKGVDTLVGGKMGRNLRQCLEQRRINWIETEGKAKETIIDVLKKEEN